MTDQERKAMEMALDALELERTDTNGNKVDLVIPAIKALRTALAQPEQEPVAFEDWLKNQHGDPEEIGFLQALRVAYYAGADSHPAPPSKPEKNLDVGIDVTEFGTQLVIRRGNEIIKSEFYKAPSKPWVSLTDEEIDYIYKQNHNQYGEDITGEYERELEAKLKEKNT